MDLLLKLSDEKIWLDFLQSKIDGGHFSRFDEKELRSLIEERRYLPVAEAMHDGGELPLPRVVEISKKHSSKRRRVFIYDSDVNWAFKLLASLLYRYDGFFASNLYSFRKRKCVKNAMRYLLRSTRRRPMYSYKVDISDYFNSIDVGIMINILRTSIIDDVRLREFIISVLSNPFCLKGGQKIVCSKGIMAGVPISGFLADLYLADMDHWFRDRGIVYARYSDDIIVFAETEQQIHGYEAVIKDFLSARKLKVNPQKEVRTLPTEAWTFLGFSVDGNVVDISDVSLQKVKDKMRRKAHALVRWKKRNDAVPERAMRAFIKHFNKKFYDNPDNSELTWCRWYFPIITTDVGLRQLDEYMIACIRYIATGRHTKANYNLRYEEIKRMKYKSLVNAYYRFKKTGQF